MNTARKSDTQMAELLKTKLTKDQFLRLQELLDGSEFGMYDAVSKIASELAPERFVEPRECAKK